MRFPFLLIFGGSPNQQQVSKPLEILVNNPKRLIFLQDKGPVSFKNSSQESKKAFLKMNRYFNFINVLKDKNLRYQTLHSLASAPCFTNNTATLSLPTPAPQHTLCDHCPMTQVAHIDFRMINTAECESEEILGFSSKQVIAIHSIVIIVKAKDSSSEDLSILKLKRQIQIGD